MFNNIQLPVITASLISLVISFTICFIFIKFIQIIKSQKMIQRLNTLNIVPLGGIAMASSFYLGKAPRKAGSDFVYISILL